MVSFHQDEDSVMVAHIYASVCFYFIELAIGIELNKSALEEKHISFNTGYSRTI